MLRNYSVVLLLVSSLASAQTPDVDPLTGAVSVHLPIWTVKAGDLSAPVSLIHVGHGMKVNDSEGNAGMGWNLSAGGQVYRSLRALPDDLVGSTSGNPSDGRNGWLHGNNSRLANDFVSTSDTNLTNCTDELADYNTLSGFGFLADTEPDIFSFNAPGLGGQFLFDRDKGIKLVPHQDIKVVYFRNADSLIYKFEITNNVGVKYTFEGVDPTIREISLAEPLLLANFRATYNYYAERFTRFYSLWDLTQVASPGGAVLTFTYDKAEPSRNASWARIVNSSGFVDSIYAVIDKSKSRSLSKISGPAEEVSFSWKGSLLSEVKVLDLVYNASKSFKLTYAVPYSLEAKATRYFLVKFTEEVNCSVFPAFTFEYHGLGFIVNTYSSNLPFNTQIQQDNFGYFNNTGTSHNPDVYIRTNDSGTDGERFRTVPASSYSLLAGSSATRAIDTSKVYYGSLKKVNYPSGGYSLIAYESNDYHDDVTSQSARGAGVRVKSVKTSANDPASDGITRFTYKAADGKSSGRWTYPPVFAYGTTTVVIVPDNLAPEERILYSRTTVLKTGRGRTVYTHDVPAMYPVTSQDGYTAPFSKIARSDNSTNCSFGSFKTGYFSFPHADNSALDYKRGMPLEVAEYTSDNKLVRQKLFTYDATTTTTAQISGIRIEPFVNTIAFSKYTLHANKGVRIVTEKERLYDQADVSNQKFVESVTTYAYNSGQLVSDVGTTNSDGIVQHQSFKYAGDYSAGGTDTNCQMLYGLVAANRHGTPIEVLSLSGSSVTGGTLMLFNNNFGASRILPATVLSLGTTSGFSPSSISGSAFTYSSNYFSTAYTDAYDGIGNPLTVRSHNRATTSAIIGNSSFPVLSIANASSTQVVYADFEPFLLSQTVTTSGAATTSELWAGKRSLSMTAANTVTMNPVVKGKGRYYRFTCWAKASGNVTLTIKYVAGSTVTTTVNYTGSNNWQFLEKRVDMNSVSSGTNFSFELSTSAAVFVDNMAFYPESASLIAKSYEPLNGVTSTFDSRGIGQFSEYDVMGRVRYVKNHDKDVVSVTDYHYKTDALMTPGSAFSVSWDGGYTFSAMTPNDKWLRTNSVVVFTPLSGCVTGAGYDWYVDDVLQTTGVSGGVLTRSFPLNKPYEVKLVASTTAGQSLSQQTIQPLPYLSATSTLQAGESSTFSCSEESHHRHVTVAISGAYVQGSAVSYSWYRKVGAAAEVLMATTTTNTFDHFLVGQADNTIICKVYAPTLNERDGTTEGVSQTTSITISWQGPTGPCN